MAKISGVVVGIEKLESKLKALERLPESDKFAHIFLTAATIGENAVWAKTPVGKTGNLRKGLVSDLLPKPEIGAYVGGKARHTHLLESGTKERKHKGGKSTGKGPQTKFFSDGIRLGRRRFKPYIEDSLRKLVTDEASG